MEWQPGGDFFKNFPKLLREARAGSKEAKEKLFLPFQHALRRWANRTAGRQMRPESDSDVTQGIFVRAWQSFDEFRGETEREFIAWLKTIFLNELNQIFRYHHQEKRDISRTVALDVAIAEHLVVGETRTPLDGLILAEGRKAVRNALQELPKEYLPFVALHYSRGMTYEEVGEKLHCSPESARKKCERAKMQLIRRLAPDRGGACD
jgi:RNA polymerase sigma-70 factor (ECF subfamily)